MYLAKLVFVFIALTLDGADTVTDSQGLRTNTLAQCQKLKTTYDALHEADNADSPFAFRNRWASVCVPMLLTTKHARV